MINVLMEGGGKEECTLEGGINSRLYIWHRRVQYPSGREYVVRDICMLSRRTYASPHCHAFSSETL